jgi:hypothetical protein
MIGAPLHRSYFGFTDHTSLVDPLSKNDHISPTMITMITMTGDSCVGFLVGALRRSSRFLAAFKAGRCGWFKCPAFPRAVLTVQGPLAAALAEASPHRKVRCSRPLAAAV